MIKWLYDLVNLNALQAFEIRVSIDGQLALEDLDWYSGGVYGKEKSLIGLNFASFLTGLVMKKSGTPHESKGLPHHVF